MGTTGWTFRLDPWSAEYDASLLLAESEEPEARVDIRVESDTFRALHPEPPAFAPQLYFVDGVRRIEHRLRLVGPGTCFGLFGSFAVGGVAAGLQPAVVRESVTRLLCVGGGAEVPAFEALVPTTRSPLVFEPHPVPENTPLSPLAGLQGAMRRAEAALASELAAAGEIVFLDGPLTFAGSGRTAVVGFVKRLAADLPARRRVGGAAQARGRRADAALPDRATQVHPRYSWYARIAYGRAIEDALTGVVRLETAAAAGLPAARDRADLSAALLPPFASDPAHDPRAPQNLLPIGGLESRLRHLHRAIRSSCAARSSRTCTRRRRMSAAVGRVLGTQDALPLEFWVARRARASYLQLDDVVVVGHAAARTARWCACSASSTWCARATRARASTPTCS